MTGLDSLSVPEPTPTEEQIEELAGDAGRLVCSQFHRTNRLADLHEEIVDAVSEILARHNEAWEQSEREDAAAERMAT